jgi:hypothetical protein
MATASGLVGALVVVATTTPIDVGGAMVVGGVTWGGTYFFCEAGWL